MLSAILILAILGHMVRAVPLTDSCAAQFHDAIDKAMSLKETCQTAAFTDCCQVARFSKLFAKDSLTSGVYEFQAENTADMPFTINAPRLCAVCNMESSGGGWTVLIRRVPDGDVSFVRGWTEYENGFGNLDSEFWYGLKNMHTITHREPMEVEVEVRKTSGESRLLKYGNFRIDGPETQYTLRVSDPQGLDGFDSFAHHNGRKFSTNNMDNDDSSLNCVEVYGNGGGWWFGACYDLTLTRTKATLNQGSGPYVAFDFAELRVRPKSCTTTLTSTC